MNLKDGKVYKWLLIAYGIIGAIIMIFCSIFIPSISLAVIGVVVSLTGLIIAYTNFQLNLAKNKSKVIDEPKSNVQIKTVVELINVEGKSEDIVKAINNRIETLENTGHSIDNVQLIQDANYTSNRKEAYITYH